MSIVMLSLSNNLLKYFHGVLYVNSHLTYYVLLLGFVVKLPSCLAHGQISGRLNIIKTHETIEEAPLGHLKC